MFKRGIKEISCAIENAFRPQANAKLVDMYPAHELIYPHTPRRMIPDESRMI